MSTEAAHPRASDFVIRDALILVGTLGGTYGISQFLRNSIGVIAPNLASRTRTCRRPKSGCWRACSSFPLRPRRSRSESRSTATARAAACWSVPSIAIAGALLFAWAPSPVWLITARVLMGLGASCYFMAPLALYAKRFPPDRFATVAGFQIRARHARHAARDCALRLGGGGDRLARLFRRDRGVRCSPPALLIAIVIRDDKPDDRPRARETLRESLHRHAGGDARAARSGRSSRCNSSTYSSFVIVVGLWGGPYLTHIYGYSLTERGNMLLVAVVAQVIGALLWGPSDRWFSSYKIPVHDRRAADRGDHGDWPPGRRVFADRRCCSGSSRSGSPPAMLPVADRARQVAVSAGTGRTRYHAAEYRAPWAGFSSPRP